MTIEQCPRPGRARPRRHVGAFIDNGATDAATIIGTIIVPVPNTVMKGSRGIGRFRRFGQKTHEQPCELVQQRDENQRNRNIESRVEIGSHSARIGFKSRECIGNRLEERQHDDHADNAIGQIADRKPPGGRIA
jgi:hypothetical protein